MDIMKGKLIIISLVCAWYLAAIDGMTFVHQSTFDDFYPPIHISSLQEHQLLSITDCARSCKQNPNCTSFFYIDVVVPTCQLHDIEWQSTVGLDVVNGAKHYKVKEPTLPYFPYLGCPVSEEYTSVSLSDGSIFTYKDIQANDCAKSIEPSLVFKTVLRTVSTTTGNFTEAADACILEGAELSKVYTLPKLEMMFQIRNDCFGSASIWIDGNNIDATDFADLTQWVTSTLDPIPPEYWYPGQPNSITTDHCIYLYLLGSGPAQYADALCSLRFRYLCEIPYIPG